MKRRRSIFRVLQFIGAGSSEYLGFMSNGKKQAVLQSVFDYLLSKNREWDVIDLYHMPLNPFADGDFVNGLVENRVYKTAPYIALGSSWEDYFQSLSRSLRKDIRTTQKKLAKVEDQTEIIRVKSTESPANLFDMLAKTEDQSWKSDSGVLRFAGESTRGFFIELFNKFSQRQWLEVYVLKLNNEPIASELDFCYNNKMYNYIVNYSEEHRKLSPGRYLRTMAIQSAFEQGMAEYDFLEGAEAYKSRWETGHREMHQVVIAKKGALYSKAGLYLLFKAKWSLKKNRTIRKLREGGRKYWRKIRKLFDGN